MRLSVVIPTKRLDASNAMDSSIYQSLRADCDEVIFVTNEAEGLNAKINYGCRLAQGEFIAVLHDDMTALPGWADVMPKNGVGAFKIGELNDKFDTWGGIGGDYCTNPSSNPDYSAFLVFSREAYAKIFPVDEFYTTPGYQDNDLGQQIKEAGYKIECLPGKLIHHHERTEEIKQENKDYYEKKWELKTNS